MNSLANFDENEIPNELIITLVRQIDAHEGEGAILIFFPGWGDIVKVYDELKALPEAKRWQLHGLHGQLPTSEQRAVFKRPPNGIRKIVLLNSHGGNDFKPLLREMSGTTKVNMFLCNWFKETSADVKTEIFDHPDDHAGEMETSLGLAYFPEFIDRDPESGKLNADDGTCRPTRFEAVNKGWVSITRPWHLLTTNSGAGYPHEATAEKGEQLMKVLVERISGFLVELADAEVDESFPF